MKNQQGAPEALPDPSPDQLRAIARTARNSSGSASDDCGPLAYVLHGWRAAAIALRAQQAALVEAQQPTPSVAAEVGRATVNRAAVMDWFDQRGSNWVTYDELASLFHKHHTPQADSAPAVDPWRDHLADQADMIDCAALQRAMVQHGISFTEGGMEHFRASLGEMVNRFVRFAAPQGDGAPATHGDDVAVDVLSGLMKAKLAKQRAKAVRAALLVAGIPLEQVLLRKPEIIDGSEPTMTAMWRWHALEETEHKAVTYDVYGKIMGKTLRAYLLRTSTLVVITGVFLSAIAWAMARTRAIRSPCVPSLL